GQNDADWLLHPLKDARRDLGLMPFGRAIDDPYLGTCTPQIVTHFFEAWSVEKTSHSNEANDPFLVLVRKTGCCVVAGAENLPCCPAPEIDVEIFEMFSVGTYTPFRGRSPTIKRCNQAFAGTR